MPCGAAGATACDRLLPPQFFDFVPFSSDVVVDKAVVRATVGSILGTPVAWGKMASGGRFLDRGSVDRLIREPLAGSVIAFGLPFIAFSGWVSPHISGAAPFTPVPDSMVAGGSKDFGVAETGIGFKLLILLGRKYFGDL